MCVWGGRKTISGSWPIYCVHCLQEKTEKATFGKDCIHCLKPIYIMLQVSAITYLMITDKTCFQITNNILILHLEITAYTAYTGCKGQVEEDMFSEGYIYILYSLFT